MGLLTVIVSTYTVGLIGHWICEHLFNKIHWSELLTKLEKISTKSCIGQNCVDKKIAGLHFYFPCLY